MNQDLRQLLHCHLMAVWKLHMTSISEIWFLSISNVLGSKDTDHWYSQGYGMVTKSFAYGA